MPKQAPSWIESASPSMTRPTTPLLRHLLTRSDLAKLQVPAGRVLAWLAAGDLEQIGSIANEDTGEDPVFCVTSRALSGELALQLATIGKDFVVFTPLRVRSLLMRAMLQAKDVAPVAEPRVAAERCAGEVLDPGPDAANLQATIEHAGIADVFERAAAGREHDQELLLNLALDEVQMELREWAEHEKAEASVAEARIPDPVAQAAADPKSDAESESVGAEDPGDDEWFDAGDLLDDLSEPTPLDPPTVGASQDSEAPNLVVDDAPVAPGFDEGSAAVTTEPATAQAHEAAEPTIAHEEVGGDSGLPETIEELPAMDFETSAPTQATADGADSVPRQGAAPEEVWPATDPATDTLAVERSLGSALDAVFGTEPTTRAAADDGTAVGVEPKAAETNASTETLAEEQTLDPRQESVADAPSPPTEPAADPIAEPTPGSPLDELMAEVPAPPRSEETTAMAAHLEAAVPGPVDPRAEPTPAAATVPVPAPVPHAVSAPAPSDRDDVAAMAVERVESFLAELKDVLVGLADRPSAPPVDLSGVVSAIEGGLAEVAAKSVATASILNQVMEKLVEAERSPPPPSAPLAIHTRATAHHVPSKVVTLPVLAASRWSGTLVALVAVGILLLAWTGMFWFKTGDVRLAMTTLIGANAVGACMLLGRR